MRIISGTARGRRIDVPKTDEVRPTADRVREALFSHLGSVVFDAKVLDLFGGSGALGLESLSRGASHATFVERSKGVYRNLTKNVSALGFDSNATIYCMDGLAFLKKNRLRQPLYDLIFLDPPYKGPLLAGALALIGEYRCLSADGLIVAEHPEEELVLPPTLQLIRTKRYGRTSITTVRLQLENTAEASQEQ